MYRLFILAVAIGLALLASRDGRQETHATEPTEEDIKRRAYDLWEKAGQPEGRDEEFYRLAEQQLRNEGKSDPTRTPDTL